jgi:hypothetical protein
MGMLEAIQGSAFATWVRESPSIFGYTAILSLHAIGLATVVGVNSIVAISLLGGAPKVPLRPTLRFFPVMYAGFWINALSGLALLAANATGMLANAMFYIKMVFVALAVVCLRLIRNIVFGSPAALDDGVLPARARTLAIASLACWTLAIISGRLTAYPNFVETWLGI